MDSSFVSLYSCILLLGFATIVTSDDSPLSQLRQSVFFGYDRHVIPQKVGTTYNGLTKWSYTGWSRESTS